MVVEEINFLDLACLLRIGPDTVMEKFGSLINTSFFDASSIAGTLKQKDLIEFTSDFPGPNGMKVTAAGKTLISEAEAKSAEPFDTLDSMILQQLSGGKRLPMELGNSLNVRPKDLALRIYKLFKQNYLIYDLKNGGVDLLLTESGFLKIKNMPPSSAPNLAQQAPMPTQPAPQHGKIAGFFQAGKVKQEAAAAKELDAQNTQAPETMPAHHGNSLLPYAIVIIVVIVIAVLYFMKII